MSWLIKRYGGGAHSHAAMAHWDDDDLQCVEFREFKGGRAVSMKSQVETHPDNIDEFLNDAHNLYKSGVGLAFAVVDKQANRVAGSTRFMRADVRNKRIEIGFTFLGKTWQRTHINTEAKLLMFSHAFEKMGLNRVEFRADYLNGASRRALLRLGAKEEGILRNHMVMPNGRVRDSVVYSVIRNEWPGVKQHLHSKLA